MQKNGRERKAAYPWGVKIPLLFASGTKTHISGHFTCQAQQKPSCFEPTILSSNLTGSEYRHVPTSRLAILAQRLGKVFCPTQKFELVESNGLCKLTEYRLWLNSTEILGRKQLESPYQLHQSAEFSYTKVQDVVTNSTASCDGVGTSGGGYKESCSW